MLGGLGCNLSSESRKMYTRLLLGISGKNIAKHEAFTSQSPRGPLVVLAELQS